MKASTKKWFYFGFLFFTLGIVIYIGLSGNDIADLWSALRKLSLPSLLLCLLCWCGYILTDAFSIYYFLKKQEHPISFGSSIYIAIIGIYYCNITPTSSGGQPIQIFRMKQRGVPIGIAGSSLTVKFFCFQSMLLVIGTILWIVHADFVFQHAEGLTWIIFLGYFFNFLSIGMVLIMAISQRAMRFIIALCIRIGTKLRICKDPEKSAAKWEAHCASFLQSVQLIRKRPRDLIVQFVIAVAQLFCLMAVILAIYHAFGLSGVSTMELLTLGVLLYISASYTPLPGASGAQEGGFAVFFRGIFPDASLFVALMIWRFSTYYLSILVGVIVSIFEGVHGLSGGASRDKGEAAKDLPPPGESTALRDEAALTDKPVE